MNLDHPKRKRKPTLRIWNRSPLALPELLRMKQQVIEAKATDLRIVTIRTQDLEELLRLATEALTG